MRCALAVVYASLSLHFASAVVMPYDLAQQYSCEKAGLSQVGGPTKNLTSSKNSTTAVNKSTNSTNAPIRINPSYDGVIITSTLVCIVLAILGSLTLYSMCVQRPESDLWQCSRLIPFKQSFAFGVSLIGVVLGACALSLVLKAIHTIFDAQKPEALLEGFLGGGLEHPKKLPAVDQTIRVFFEVTLGFVIVLNLIATVYGLMGAGCIREHVFGQYGRGSDQCAMKCLQCCLGPFFTRVVRLGLWVTFTMMLLLPFFFIPLAIIMHLLDNVCGKPVHEAKHAVNAILKQINYPEMNGHVIHVYCETCGSTGTAASLLIVSCLMNLYTQVIMLTALAKEQAKINNEMKHMEERHKVQEEMEEEKAEAELGDAGDVNFPQPRKISSAMLKPGNVLPGSDPFFLQAPADEAKRNDPSKHPNADQAGMVYPGSDPFFLAAERSQDGSKANPRSWY